MVSNKRVFMLIILFITCSSILMSMTLDDIYRQVMDKYNTIDYYTANFIQHNYWRIQDRRIESQGNIHIAGQKIAIIFSQPQGQKMIIDEAVFLVDDMERNIIITELEHTGGVYKPTDIFSFYWEKSARELDNENDQYYIVFLYPEDDPHTAKVEVRIRRSDLLVTGITYTDHQNNSVMFEFSNERINQPIDSRIFDITYDEGYTVIDNRENVPPRNRDY